MLADNRFIELANKLISIKGVFAIVLTVSMFLGKIDSWAFLAGWSVIIGGRTIEKFIAMKKEITNG